MLMLDVQYAMFTERDIFSKCSKLSFETMNFHWISIFFENVNFSACFREKVIENHKIDWRHE